MQGKAHRNYRQRKASSDSEDDEQEVVVAQRPPGQRKSRVVLPAHEVPQHDAANMKPVIEPSRPEQVPGSETFVAGTEVPLHLRTCSSRGRGIFAVSTISPGTTLITEQAYASVLDDQHLLTHCSSCFQPRPRFRCSKCALLRYCSQQCQRVDWAVHRQECKVLLKAPSPKLATTSFRAICRILSRRFLDSDSFTKVEALESHRQKRSTQQIEQFAQMAALIVRLMEGVNTLSPSEVLSLICRYSCNAMAISDESLANIAGGIFPTLSLINHSCRPNAAIVFSGSTAVLRSIRPIAPGEEILQSYTEISEPQHVRQKELSEAYFFKCDCTECRRDETELDSRTTCKCRQPGCEGIVTISEPLIDPKCNVRGLLSPSEVQDLEEALALQLQLYQQAVDCREHNPNVSLVKAEECLASQELLYGPLSPGLLRTLRLLHDLYLSELRFSEAYATTTRLFLIYQDLYRDFYHPITSIMALMRFKLASMEECLVGLWEALRIGADALTLLEVTHGKKHKLYAECNETIKSLEMHLMSTYKTEAHA
ncbi:hypothetical protein HDU85_006299 [Gaertneriomyces sp. JEL0708]|nr:hypothetical protein HDU85_006299 [Gaertneriomyces sp. JEL0708]